MVGGDLDGLDDGMHSPVRSAAVVFGVAQQAWGCVSKLLTEQSVHVYSGILPGGTMAAHASGMGEYHPRRVRSPS